MSDGMTDSMRDLAPGYALGALTPEETRSFEAALATSPELQREVAELRELNALLAQRDRLAPPPGLKQRLRERIGTEKRAALPTRASGARTRSRAPQLLLGFGLAASLVLAAGLYLRLRSLQQTLSGSEQRLAEREATLNALLEPTVQLTTLTATGQAPPIVQVFWNRAANTLILHTFRLKPAPDGRTYQLWLLPKQGKPIPSTLFNTEPTGHQLVQGITVPADQQIAGFALTVEPAGGSPQPTTTPILAGTTGGT
jgi:anti-sigma-K factor RskA